MQFSEVITAGIDLEVDPDVGSFSSFEVIGVTRSGTCYEQRRKFQDGSDALDLNSFSSTYI